MDVGAPAMQRWDKSRHSPLVPSGARNANNFPVPTTEAANGYGAESPEGGCDQSWHQMDAFSPEPLQMDPDRNR